MSVNMSAAIAAHRFGLGEADLQVVGKDPRAWLVSQIGPADTQVGVALPSSLEALLQQREVVRRGQQTGATPVDEATLARGIKLRADLHRDRMGEKKLAKADKPGAMERMAAKEANKDIMVGDLQARLLTATLTKRPFAERLAMFWSNHFTVSQVAPASRGLVGAFEREAVRPHIAGSFEDMLRATTHHPAMLRYLDNHKSVGPNSAEVLREQGRQRKVKPKKALGLNENLAREVLELHTLGAESSRHPASPKAGYTQADVTEFARVLTGWTTADQPDATQPVVFDVSRHEPGPKTLLGKTYPSGEQALDMVLHDLASHPATAHFLATKLARHFVADEPPAGLVDTLREAYIRSGGQLAPVYEALIDAPESWAPTPRKLKTPEEFAVSSARVLGAQDRWLGKHRDGAVEDMGQHVQWAPSPAGWSDRAEDWLGPDAVWKRIEWSTRMATTMDTQVDARGIANRAFGPALAASTLQQVSRAADGTQAMTLLLMSPDFQRR